MISTHTKIERLSGLLGTKDLNPREAKFVENMKHQQAEADRLGMVLDMTDAQRDWLDDLFTRHFAG